MSRFRRHHRPDAPSTEELLQSAMTHWGRDPDAFDQALARLTADLGVSLPAAERVLDRTVADLWQRGWAPTDVVHVAAHRLTGRHAATVAAAVIRDDDRRAGDGQTRHSEWRDQVANLRRERRTSKPLSIDRLRRLIDASCVLMRLPGIPPTLPPPGDPRSGLPGGSRLDGRMLERVRSLLAKAESTTFEEEAQALTTKAQELIARHAIDEALLHRSGDVGRPSVRRIPVENPYATAKAYVLAEVAGANRCRVVHSPDLGWVTAFGYDHDLAAVELLATSLLAQATSSMSRQGVRRDARGRSRTKSFRRAFLLGFGQRIGERLRQASEEQVADTVARDDSLVPVLAARQDRVVAAEEEAFPDIRRRSASVSNPSGWTHGRAAGNRASLDVTAPRLPRS